MIIAEWIGEVTDHSSFRGTKIASNSKSYNEADICQYCNLPAFLLKKKHVLEK